MNENVPKKFKKINNYKLKIEDDKIYCACENEPIAYVFFSLILILNFVLIFWITEKYYGQYTRIPKDDPISFLGGILLGIQFIIYDIFIRLYNVIDFSEGYIYKELYFFGARTKFSFYSRKEIIQIGNSVVGQTTNPGGKRRTINGRAVKLNPKTNLFHSYQVQFLLASGEVLRLELGYFDENYFETKEFVSYLSDFWNIPKIYCDDDCQLVVRRLRDGVYVFDKEQIQYHSWFQKLLSLLCFFIVIGLIGYGICVGFKKFFGKKSKSNKPTYRYEHRYQYRR